MQMFLLLAILSCYAGNKTEGFLPERMPKDIRILYTYNSGMMQDAGSFDLENGVCKYEYHGNGKTQKGTKTVSSGKISKAYHELRCVGFDKIKVKPAFAPDASNITIVIYWNDSNQQVRVSKSAADEMSDEDLLAWNKSVKIIDSLLK